MKILVSADLHLGKQSSNMKIGEMESSVTFTWHRITDHVIENRMDALVLAGDIIDRDNRFFEAIGPVQKAFDKLDAAGIPVVMVSGNHDFDVLPDIIRNRNYDHVHLLGEKGRWESKIIDTQNGRLQFLGWSFPLQHVMEDPLVQLLDYDLDLDPNLPTVGLLHGDLFDRKSHYAPLDQAGFPVGIAQAWVIGHIHKPEIIKKRDPLILYPGSPQALSPKETGPHGPFLLSIEGKNADAHQVPLSPVRYEQLQIDITDAENESEFRNRVTRGLFDDVRDRVEELVMVTHMVYDILLTGRHSSMRNLENWSGLADEFESEIITETVAKVRKIVNDADPTVENLEELATQPTPPGILAKVILDLESEKSSQFLEELISELKDTIGNVNRSRTYQSLNRFDEHLPESDETARKLLLRESRHLLGELISQKAEG
ncbi:DNA repair exonuclease [soil metagenome]